MSILQSVYPTKLSIGLPKRHHVVCYIHARLGTFTAEALESRLRPSPDEVGACAWLDRQMVKAIVAADEEGIRIEEMQRNDTLPEKFK